MKVRRIKEGCPDLNSDMGLVRSLILCGNGRCWIEEKIKEKDSEQEGSSLETKTRNTMVIQ